MVTSFGDGFCSVVVTWMRPLWLGVLVVLCAEIQSSATNRSSQSGVGLVVRCFWVAALAVDVCAAGEGLMMVLVWPHGSDCCGFCFRRSVCFRRRSLLLKEIGST
ncbi:hypothetical protein RHMOL_Rhmol05G0009600 [Rhododendron molle]|uniref:Uncharacterized protein n=1 Tax=Rhododendron molle TaxID=49168 RepID=A0ACC0NLB1_RHOML|nr:hypothetical protein RHMOL_Rhmol05G0009600 [Rhododendron molle]